MTRWRRQWRRANATRDCWDGGYCMHTDRMLCLLRTVDGLWVVRNGDGRLHEIAASLALDGAPISELP